jgi:acid phosphatase family membrane protein YuiD
MDLFSVDVTLTELIFLRQASDIVSITGKDAKFLANLQDKLENEIAQIQNFQDDKKKQELAKAIAADKEKQQAKK